MCTRAPLLRRLWRPSLRHDLDEDHLAGEGAARGNTLVAVNDAALVTDVSELEYRELLVPIVRDGSAVAPRESIQDARERCAWALDHLDAAFKRFLYPQTYVVGMEQGLAQVRDELVRKNMAAASASPGQMIRRGRRKTDHFVRSAPGAPTAQLARTLDIRLV